MALPLRLDACGVENDWILWVNIASTAIKALTAYVCLAPFSPLFQQGGLDRCSPIQAPEYAC